MQILTDSNLKSEDRAKLMNSTSEMRDQAATGDPAPERKFDRAKFEALRNAMGRKKGRAPARAG